MIAFWGSEPSNAWSCVVRMAAVDPSYRLLACQYLDEQLGVLMRELLGVRRNADIEPVHQARVASRRVRAALGMFAICFDSKRAARWPKQIKKLTKELGAARDRDVQIDFINQLLTALGDDDKKARPGVARLLLRLQQGRAALQSEVIVTIDKIEKMGILTQMYGEMEKMMFALRSQDTPVCSPFVLQETRAHIFDRKAELIACEESLDDSEDTLGHHQMRIAAKKLRYTLEICNPVYGGRLANFIAAFKQVQSLLGDVHDCDVWVQDIDRFMEQEQQAAIAYYGHSRPFNRLKPGLLLARGDRAKRRQQVFGELLAYWRDLEAKHFWSALEEALEQQDVETDAGEQGEKKEEDSLAQ